MVFLQVYAEQKASGYGVTFTGTDITEEGLTILDKERLWGKCRDECSKEIGHWDNRPNLMCPNEMRCIPSFKFCDGNADCKNGSDESEEVCTENFCRNHLGRVKCPNEHRCINKEHFCNRITQKDGCQNGSHLDPQACYDFCREGRLKFDNIRTRTKSRDSGKF